MFPLLPKGDQTKLLKIFWLMIFTICHRCRWHRWQTLNCEYLREFLKKFETVLMDYSWAGGKLIHEKNQKQKISWHCPFNTTIGGSGLKIFNRVENSAREGGEASENCIYMDEKACCQYRTLFPRFLHSPMPEKVSCPWNEAFYMPEESGTIVT